MSVLTLFFHILQKSSVLISNDYIWFVPFNQFPIKKTGDHNTVIFTEYMDKVSTKKTIDESLKYLIINI